MRRYISPLFYFLALAFVPALGFIGYALQVLLPPHRLGQLFFDIFGTALVPILPTREEDGDRYLPCHLLFCRTGDIGNGFHLRDRKAGRRGGRRETLRRFLNFWFPLLGFPVFRALARFRPFIARYDPPLRNSPMTHTHTSCGNL